MMRTTRSRTPLVKLSAALALAAASTVLLAGCGGGGGGGGGSLAKVLGIVDDGAQTSPIEGADCRFVEDGTLTVIDTATSGADGRFEFDLRPDLAGAVECDPPGLPDLTLATSATTVGASPGDVISLVLVSPATTVIRGIVRQQGAQDPVAAESELFQRVGIAVQRGQLADGTQGYLAVPTSADRDNNLATLVLGATATFNEMSDQGIASVPFQDALDDLFQDGFLDTPDLGPISGTVDATLNDPENQTVLSGVDMASAARTGTVSGSVFDADGSPVPDAAVEVTRNNQVLAASRSDDSGLYTVSVTGDDTNPFEAFEVTVTARVGVLEAGTVQAVVTPLATTEGADIVVLPTRPDLVVASIEQRAPIDPSGLGYTVPIRVTVRNAGNGPAEIFKVAVNVTSSVGTFVVAFPAPPQTGFYPFTSTITAPGASVVFTGTVFISSGIVEPPETVSLVAEADSCSGEEFVEVFCRVDESDETNNLSNPLSVPLPSIVQ